jgi:hypothetical protein
MLAEMLSARFKDEILNETGIISIRARTYSEGIKKRFGDQVSG